ncbi:peptidase inhibitor family I36 protein [Streptomyces sp. NPDC058308]|uniref:peptidase inhibitor family I36 protein n=1 Tax=Streptomyces sp. NPDC058308 TaxID=3346440 RepID=UPI0036EB8870
MKKRSLLLVGAALAVFLPLTVSPASAASCPKGKVCLWLKRNFEGTHTFRKLTPGCVGTGIDAGARTVSNQSGKRISVYSEPGCYGQKVDIKTGHYSSATPFVITSVAVWG